MELRSGIDIGEKNWIDGDKSPYHSQSVWFESHQAPHLLDPHRIQQIRRSGPVSWLLDAMESVGG